jgi:hypothetical protein
MKMRSSQISSCRRRGDEALAKGIVTPAPTKRSGMVTVIFIALLAIMMILITVESRSVIRLHREVKLLEQQQIKRANPPQTNTVTQTPEPK